MERCAAGIDHQHLAFVLAIDLLVRTGQTRPGVASLLGVSPDTLKGYTATRGRARARTVPPAVVEKLRAELKARGLPWPSTR